MYDHYYRISKIPLRSNEFHIKSTKGKKIEQLPDSSGSVHEQSASFPGRDDDFKTLFCLTNSLALFAAKAACNEKRQKISRFKTSRNTIYENS